MAKGTKMRFSPYGKANPEHWILAAPVDTKVGGLLGVRVLGKVLLSAALTHIPLPPSWHPGLMVFGH